MSISILSQKAKIGKNFPIWFCICKTKLFKRVSSSKLLHLVGFFGNKQEQMCDKLKVLFQSNFFAMIELFAELFL